MTLVLSRRMLQVLIERDEKEMSERGCDWKSILSFDSLKGSVLQW